MTRIEFVAACLLAVAQPTSAIAWDSEVHTGITQLAESHRLIKGLAPQGVPYVTAKQMPTACKGLRQTTGVYHPYMLMVCGTDWPDDRRRQLQNKTHQEDARRRALDAFYCAVQKNWKSRDNRIDPGLRTQFAMASFWQFGNSLHYVGDLGDFAKMMGSNKRPVRKAAIAVIDRHIRALKQARAAPGPMDHGIYQDALNEMRAANTPSALVQFAFVKRQEGGSFFNAKLRAEGAAERRQLLEPLAATLIDFNLALANKWIEFFMRATSGNQPDPYYLQHECRMRERDWPY